MCVLEEELISIVHFQIDSNNFKDLKNCLEMLLFSEFVNFTIFVDEHLVLPIVLDRESTGSVCGGVPPKECSPKKPGQEFQFSGADLAKFTQNLM